MTFRSPTRQSIGTVLAGAWWSRRFPIKPTDRLTLLVHESWHRVQLELGLPAASTVASHLDEMEARVSLRMEFAALALALEADSADDARSLLSRALVYRLERRAAYPDAAGTEDQLEIGEGLAEYTGRRLGDPSPEASAAAALRRAGAEPSLIRAFAYFSGPAYGLLLDRFTPDWRLRVLQSATLSEVALDAAVGTTPAAELAVERREIEASEARRSDDRAHRERGWIEALVAGPTLRLPISTLQTVFDPRALVALGQHGTVYPSAKLTDRWGTAEVVDGGALIDPDWSVISLPARGMVTGTERLTGPGWELILKPGWAVRAADRGHEIVRNAPIK